MTAGVDRWADTSLEFLRRLCADWQAILAAFSPDSDPGVLAGVKAGLGDTHRGGRSVLIAQFGSGLQVVYKPRSLAVDVQFQGLLAWLNARGDHPPFRMLKVLERGPYGWVEFVTADHCASPAEVRRFYERQGGYLALLYALGAADFHFENLIAAGEHPVLIDLESLLHPGIGAVALPETDRAAGEAMADSVLRVGLLPQRVWAGADSEGVEISGLVRAAGSAHTPGRAALGGGRHGWDATGLQTGGDRRVPESTQSQWR